jgi:hypothetical protein
MRCRRQLYRGLDFPYCPKGQGRQGPHLELVRVTKFFGPTNCHSEPGMSFSPGRVLRVFRKDA